MIKIKTVSSLLALIAGGIIIPSCGGSSLTPEEEVRNFSKDFSAKVAANQLDSLKFTYPEIVKADSIVPLESDTIQVVETAPGKFDVTLAEGVTLKLDRDEKGNINVTESYGLFGFPADKMDIAKKTGMWEMSLNDAQLADRMNDTEFFEAMKERSNINPSDVITVGKFVITKEWEGLNWQPGLGYYPVTNHTDTYISADDYVCVMASLDVYDDASYPYVEKGIALDPHGTAQLKIEFLPRATPEFKKIKFNLSDEQLKAKFAAFRGTEYKDYLDSKN